MTGIQRCLRWLGALLAFALATGPAFAANEAPKGASELVFVAQLVVLILVGRLLGEVMLRFKQPAVMGQLIAGLLLGPSLFGAVFPDWQHALFPAAKEQKAMLDGIAQFGILLLLLLTGMEIDLKLVRQTGRASVFASLAGIAVPFACGVALGELLPDSILPDPGKRLITALFLGTALSIASVKIVATVIREMNFTRRTVGQVILASAIIDDTVGWIITAIIFSLALQGQVDAFSVAKSVLGTLIFMGLSFTIGRRVVFSIIRWVNDTFVSEFAVITAILLIMCVMATITDLIGVHTVLGAFVAGILIGESPILTRHIDEQLRGLIVAFFMPVFFGTAGLNADLTILKDPSILALTAGLIVIASLGKFGGAFVGGKLGGLTFPESLALGSGMNARGSTEVIVATIGLSMGVLNPNLFTMIVTMAVITTMAMPPMLRWALARIPMRKEEKQRLEREEMEQRGFVPKLERLLLAVDESANGRFASRIAGLIAGANALPTTVMHIKTDKKTGKAAANAEKEKAKTAAETVKVFAGHVERAQSAEEKTDTKLAVTTMVENSPERQGGRGGSREGLRFDAGRARKNRRDRGQRIPRRHRRPRRGLRRPDCNCRCARQAARTSAARQTRHAGAGQRHRNVAPRGRSRHRHGARQQGFPHRALCRPRRQEETRAPIRRGHPQGHRRARRKLRTGAAHHGARRRRRRGSDPQGIGARQAQPHRHGRRPPPGRETVLRRHRRGFAGEVGALAAVRRELNEPSVRPRESGDPVLCSGFPLPRE